MDKIQTIDVALILFFYIIPLILCISFAIICSSIAQSKGRSSLGWGLLGFFFGLFGIILIAVASDLEKERKMYDLLYSLQPEKKEPERKTVLLAKSSNASLSFTIERVGYFKPEVRVIFTLLNASEELLCLDLFLETKHDLVESDIRDIRWLEHKIEVDILHNRKKPPRTYTFEY